MTMMETIKKVVSGQWSVVSRQKNKGQRTTDNGQKGVFLIATMAMMMLFSGVFLGAVPNVHWETVMSVPTPTPSQKVFTASNNGEAFIYVEQNGFRLEINGDKFTSESRILISNYTLATTFINPQKLTANIPADLFRDSKGLKILVFTPNSKKCSDVISINLQMPPLPQFKFIGVTIRRENNLNTAVIKENDKESLVRVNDAIGGRFQVISISRDEIKVKDIYLGFEYSIKMLSGGLRTSTNNPANPPINPNCPPGIPCDKYPVATPKQDQRQKTTKDDYDDDGDN